MLKEEQRMALYAFFPFFLLLFFRYFCFPPDWLLEEFSQICCMWPVSSVGPCTNRKALLSKKMVNLECGRHKIRIQETFHLACHVREIAQRIQNVFLSQSDPRLTFQQHKIIFWCYKTNGMYVNTKTHTHPVYRNTHSLLHRLNIYYSCRGNKRCLRF